MIRLQFENVNQLWQEIDNKIAGMSEIVNTRTANQIAKAVFTITTKRFLKDFALEAKGNPQKYHHVFEWKNVGNMNQRLFEIKRESLGGGNLTINIRFKKSQTPVPIPRALSSRIRRRHTFVNKAEVMESGKPVGFTTRNYIVFMYKGHKVFRPPGVDIIINNPGGKQTAGAFDKYVTRWYGRNVDSTLRTSGLFSNIERAVGIAINRNKGGKTAARAAIDKTVAPYIMYDGTTEVTVI